MRENLRVTDLSSRSVITPLDEEVVGEDVYLNIINKSKKICIHLYSLSNHRQ